MIKTYSREGKKWHRQHYKKKCEQQTPDEDEDEDDVEKLNIKKSFGVCSLMHFNKFSHARNFLQSQMRACMCYMHFTIIT